MENFKNKVIYQIYPKSFYDSSGDGIGDFAGITEKLPYLASLHPDYLLLAPVLAGHDVDAAYAVTDYYDVNEEYGTLDDFRTLIFEAKRYNIGILMEFPLAHTSEEHSWFQEALSDFNSPFRDYYFFQEGKKGLFGKKIKNPPNNWKNVFGEEAWQREEDSDQYYLTTFTDQHCDLNWENPQLRQGMHEILTFWLDKGIAGFYFEMADSIGKSRELIDLGKKNTKSGFPADLITAQPSSHQYLRELNDQVLCKYNCITIGSGMACSSKDTALYSSPNRRELHMMSQTSLHWIGGLILDQYRIRKSYSWNIPDFKDTLDQWQADIEKNHGWTVNFLTAKDQNRAVSRFGNDRKYRRSSAKALALMNVTLRGTPLLYQGEEYGHTDAKTKLEYPCFHSRTPIQWDSTENGGFSLADPRLDINANYHEVNIDSEINREDSLISFYQRLIRLRKEHLAINYGGYIPMFSEHKQILSYIRNYEEERILVLINLSGKRASLDLGDFLEQMQDSQLLFHTHLAGELDQLLRFEAYEGMVYRL